MQTLGEGDSHVDVDHPLHVLVVPVAVVVVVVIVVVVVVVAGRPHPPPPPPPAPTTPLLPRRLPPPALGRVLVLLLLLLLARRPSPLRRPGRAPGGRRGEEQVQLQSLRSTLVEPDGSRRRLDGLREKKKEE